MTEFSEYLIACEEQRAMQKHVRQEERICPTKPIFAPYVKERRQRSASASNVGLGLLRKVNTG